MERQLEDSIRSCVADFTIRKDGRKGSVIRSSTTDNKLTDATSPIECAVRRLRRESLIDMVVSIQDYIHIVIV